MRGRMLPEGLRYIDSWIVEDDRLDTCFQLMETNDPSLFDVWGANWSDLGEFEVVTNAPASTTVPGRNGDACQRHQSSAPEGTAVVWQLGTSRGHAGTRVLTDEQVGVLSDPAFGENLRRLAPAHRTEGPSFHAERDSGRSARRRRRHPRRLSSRSKDHRAFDDIRLCDWSEGCLIAGECRSPTRARLAQRGSMTTPGGSGVGGTTFEPRIRREPAESPAEWTLSVTLAALSEALDCPCVGFKSSLVEVMRLLLNPSFAEELRELTRSS